MGKIKRGNYQFVTWIGDHDDHVHVYQDGRMVLKWDLEQWKKIEGESTARLIAILEELVKEGLL